MKALVLCVGLLTACALPAFAAEPSPACAAKRVHIERQLSEARARGNTQEIKGLQRALKANIAHCTDASLAKEREAQIAKAQREVAKRERDLREAERKGDAQKIATRKAKLEEAQHELAEAQKPLMP